MPDMNRYQLAREVRQLPGYKHTPMVAVTGYSMFDDMERSTKAGFSAHMTKPIDPRALLDLIEQLWVSPSSTPNDLSELSSFHLARSRSRLFFGSSSSRPTRSAAAISTV